MKLRAGVQQEAISLASIGALRCCHDLCIAAGQAFVWLEEQVLVA